MSLLRDNVNSGPSDLRSQMRDFVVSAGVFNGISALIAQRAGFRSAYLSGSGIAGAMGLPDLSVTTLTEVSTEVRRIVSVAKIPLIVDIDTGFGEAINVIRTIREMENAGASAIHMEDQVLPKRCGHLSGKSVIASSDMVKKIKAAVSARKNPDFVIIARTDARSVNGLEDAISRANEYVEAGADAIFSEALESREEFLKFSREVKAPLMANMTEFGRSPLLSVDELRSIGYKMVIFPLTAFRAVLKNMDSIYRKLYSAGTQRDFMDSILSRKEFYDIIGYSEYEDEDRILGTEE
ncbi:MAG: methylisocitrate lyase [Thermoplasmata archaeon]